jgi:hypothetical protein
MSIEQRSSNEINRRLKDGMITETVHAWHCREQGPGEPGGRTYGVIYGRDGRVRIDVTGGWGSSVRTIFLGASEMRPDQEWWDHLLATGQKPVARRWCTVDGVEIPSDSDPELDENCCSPDCRNDLRPNW